ncbi:aldo/keto reductase, partial [Rhizobium ruizarguesonis]
IAPKFSFKLSASQPGPAAIPGVASRHEHVRAVAEASLTRLGIEPIDLFYQQRVDPDVPIKDTVGVMAELVQDSNVRAIGLSA